MLIQRLEPSAQKTHELQVSNGLGFRGSNLNIWGQGMLKPWGPDKSAFSSRNVKNSSESSSQAQRHHDIGVCPMHASNLGRAALRAGITQPASNVAAPSNFQHDVAPRVLGPKPFNTKLLCFHSRPRAGE